MTKEKHLMVRLPEDFYMQVRSVAYSESHSLQKWLEMVLRKYLEERNRK